MKQFISMLLCLSLLFAAGIALADTSVLRQEGQFSVHFANSTATETHAMALRQGDHLEIQAYITEGSANVTIKHNDGDILYSGIGDDTPGFSLVVPNTGIYRITIAGANAVGSVRVYATEARVETEANEPPFRLERIVSNLGYLIEYDPDFFTYLPGATGEGELFYANTEQNSPEVLVWTAREPLSLEDAVAEVLATEGFVELEASLIDFRAARTLRYQQGSSFDSPISLYTIIEVGENEVLCLMANYYVAVEQSVAGKVERMIESLHFTR